MKPVHDEIAVPVIAEEFDVSTRTVVTGGVRVNKTVRERQETIDLPLVREEVNVHRVVKNERVNGPLPIRQDGDTTIIPVVKEVVVTEKYWVLAEELYVTKRRTEERSQQKVVLHYEEADVQRMDASGRSTGPALVTDMVDAASTVSPIAPSVPIRQNKILK